MHECVFSLNNIFSRYFQTSTDGNTTTSTLSFVASKEDDGKYLSCRAENKVLSTEGLEDGWKLEIHCKEISFIFPQLITRAHQCYEIIIKKKRRKNLFHLFQHEN